MKKLLSVLLIFLLCTSLFACKSTTYKNSSQYDYGGDDLTNSELVNLIPNFTIDETVSENNVITVKNYITDNMVLQRNFVNIISGTTTAAHIAAQFDGIMYYGNVQSGEFKIYLSAHSEAENLDLTLYCESGKKTVRNICVGEVFLLSGQSNAKWSLAACGQTHLADIESADDEFLRIMQIEKVESQSVCQEISTNGWEKPNSLSARSFSAVGYLTGKNLRTRLNIPIGIIVSAVGGTLLCYWLDGKSYVDASKNHNIKQVSGKAEGTPSLGFNGMIAPLKDIKFRGFVYYQGESNATNCDYEIELTALVNGWRNYFERNVPFIIVELPRYNVTDYSSVREAQQKVCNTLSGAFLSINIDLGDTANIHPSDKSILSLRICDTICDKIFCGQKMIYPTLEKVVKVSENSVKLTFSNVGDVIILKNGMNGFEYSSSALGLIFHEFEEYEFSDNGELILNCEEKITYIRYGYKRTFADNEITNNASLQTSVFNSYGLPLDQFKMKID